jgi:hypothetical protein
MGEDKNDGNIKRFVYKENAEKERKQSGKK